jgi:Tfp pilus assembly protein PilN
MNKDKPEPPSTEPKGQSAESKEAAQKDGNDGFQYHFRYTILALIIPLLLCLVPALWVEGEIAYQQSRNQFLEREIEAAEQRMQEIADLPSLKVQYLSKGMVYTHLRSDNWPDVVQMLGELSRRLPEGISVRSMKLQGGKLTLTGIALSGEAVELLNARLVESGLKAASDLQITLTELKEGRVGFTLEQRDDLVVGSDPKGGGR